MRSFILIAVALLAAGCSSSEVGGGLTGPTRGARQFAVPAYDLVPVSIVTYVNLGTVIVDNRSGRDQPFTFVVKEVTDPTDATGASQIVRGVVTQTIPKGD